MYTAHEQFTGEELRQLRREWQGKVEDGDTNLNYFEYLETVAERRDMRVNSLLASDHSYCNPALPSIREGLAFASLVAALGFLWGVL